MRVIGILLAGAMLVAPSVVHAANPVEWVRNTLQARAGTLPAGTAEQAAIQGTLSRIRNLTLPETGRVIVVNIASGVVTAYQDGTPVMESKAVVGKKETPTPELDNLVTFIRPNPTWTVPQSIIKRKNWRDKLAADPSFFEEAGFDVILNGQTVSAHEAADQASSVTTFVQRPGRNNALGALKIGLNNDQAIYMHDTNDPGRFEDAVRSASAGCVRIEEVRDLAAWIMQVPAHHVDELIEGGDKRNHTPPEPVRVILGYWTAWPDANDHVRFYPDIYRKDGANQSYSSQEWEDEGQTATDDAPDWSRDHNAEPVNQGPRFIPGPVTQPEPIWSERIAR